MENRFLRLIEILTRHNVRFIVVGGVAAVLQRVPINTQDFDLVHDRAKDNVARLLLALAELGAEYADDPRHLKPNESHLVGPGNGLLRSGNLKFDLLGSIDIGGGYEDLLPCSEVLDVGGSAVRTNTGKTSGAQAAAHSAQGQADAHAPRGYSRRTRKGEARAMI